MAMKSLHPSRNRPVLLVLAAFATACVSAAITHAAPPPPKGEVVELPALTVTAKRELPPPEMGWNYARFLNFEVLSELTERQTKDFIYYFGQYVNILTAIMPPTEIRTNPIADFNSPTVVASDICMLSRPER